MARGNKKKRLVRIKHRKNILRLKALARKRRLEAQAAAAKAKKK